MVCLSSEGGRAGLGAEVRLSGPGRHLAKSSSWTRRLASLLGDFFSWWVDVWLRSLQV